MCDLHVSRTSIKNSNTHACNNYYLQISLELCGEYRHPVSRYRNFYRLLSKQRKLKIKYLSFLLCKRMTWETFALICPQFKTYSSPLPLGKYHRRQDVEDIQAITPKLKIFLKYRMFEIILFTIIWRKKR